LLEPGIIGIDHSGSFLRNDTAANLGAKIRRGAYNEFVAADLNLEPGQRAGVRFDVEEDEAPPNTEGAYGESIRVSCRSTSPALCQRMLASLIGGLEREKSGSFEYIRKNAEAQIATRHNDIARIDWDTRDRKAAIEANEKARARDETEKQRLEAENREAQEAMRGISEEIEPLRNALKEIQAETEAMQKGRERISGSAKEKSGPGPSVLEYNATLLNRLARAQSLSRELAERRWELEEQRSLIEQNDRAIKEKNENIAALAAENLKHKKLVEGEYPQRKKELEGEIEALEAGRGALAAVKVIQEPSVPWQLARKRWKMVLGAFVASAALCVVVIALRVTMQKYSEIVEEGANE